MRRATGLLGLDDLDVVLEMGRNLDDMDVSENSGVSPQIIHGLIGFFIINHPFWGAPIFGNTHICVSESWRRCLLKGVDQFFAY